MAHIRCLFGILFARLFLVGGVEVVKGSVQALGHGLLALAYPDTGVKVLLVGLVLAVGVADSAHQVVLLVQDIVTHTAEVGILQVGVQVDLDDAVADGLLVLGLGGAGAAVEDEEDGLVLAGAGLLLDVGLVLGQELGVKSDVAWLVDAVDVAEASGNGEVRADGSKSVVDVEDVLGLGVERVVVNVLVVDTILLATSDADFLSFTLETIQQKQEQQNWTGLDRTNSPSRATASWGQHA